MTKTIIIMTIILIIIEIILIKTTVLVIVMIIVIIMTTMITILRVIIKILIIYNNYSLFLFKIDFHGFFMYDISDLISCKQKIYEATYRQNRWEN